MSDSIQLIQVTSKDFDNLISNHLERFTEALLNQFSNTQQEGKEILTRKETAELLGISFPTLHDWNDKGITHPYKMGNRTYYKRSEILETLANSNLKAS